MKLVDRIKKILKSNEYFFNDLLNSKDSIKVDWVSKENNFGDILNPILLAFLTNKKILKISAQYYKKEHLLCIGSILHKSNSDSIVWGSGFINENTKKIECPKKIGAVRGPKTRGKLIEMGIECPEVYGDPALLISDFYRPKIEKKYKFGILPHYVDKESDWIKKQKDNGLKIIDIQNPNPLNVIDQMLECETVITSSLHGLIISDAYNIPSIWVKLSDRLTGGNFKFHDYFLSVGRELIEPCMVSTSTTIDDLIQFEYSSDIIFDKAKLVRAFPFEIEQEIYSIFDESDI